jgi:hypothetical protein
VKEVPSVTGASVCSVCRQHPIYKFTTIDGRKAFACRCGHWIKSRASERYVFEDAKSNKPTLHFLIEPDGEAA